MRSLAAVAPCLIAIVACSSEPSNTWPAENWPNAAPSLRDKNQILIEELRELLGSGAYGNIDRFLLIHDGKLLIDLAFHHDYKKVNEGLEATDDPYSYFNPNWHPFYRGTSLHTVQSTTKSVTAAAIGVAIHRGNFPPLATRVVDYLPGYEIQHDSELKRSITIDDLLTMRVGMDWNELSTSYTDPNNVSTRMERAHDWDQFTLNQPMLHEPGTVFTYNSGASQLLSRVLEVAIGMRVEEYAQEFLFGPLGITEYYWKKTPGGRTDTVAGLYLRAEDLARIGYLYLRDGVWNGTQLMVPGWPQKSMQSPTRGIRTISTPWQVGYGYHWWNYCSDPGAPCEVMAGLGWGGQILLVHPQQDLVAVFYGWNIYGEDLSDVSALFLEKITSGVSVE